MWPCAEGRGEKWKVKVESDTCTLFACFFWHRLERRERLHQPAEDEQRAEPAEDEFEIHLKAEPVVFA